MNSNLRVSRRYVVATGAATVAGPVLAQRQTGERIVLATVSGAYREGFESLARAYERRHPGTRVEVQILPVNGYETWLRTQIPSRGPGAPDLFNANYAWGMFEKGLTIDFGPHLRRTNPYTGKPWIDTLDARMIEKARAGGYVNNLPIDLIEIGFYYNRDLFRKHGLARPTTWDELVKMASTLQRAGLVPFAVPGNADSYWSGAVGWIARFFSDAYTRRLVPLVMARPGDWDYDPATNRAFRLDLGDPFNDALVKLSGERQLLAIRDGRIRFDDGRFREMYGRLREFSEYWQRGFHGASAQTAYTLFLTQRAACFLETSAGVGQLLRDMAELPPRKRFRWGVFQVPPLTTSRFSIPAFRGVGGAGTVIGIVKKDPSQVARSLDFLMFLAAPENARRLVQEAVSHRRPINGPMLIKGVDLPESIRDHYRPFEGRGFEKLSFRGLLDDQESVWQWTVWAQRYMDGLIGVEEFLRRYQRLMTEAVPRVAATQKLDLNPATRDIAS